MSTTPLSQNLISWFQAAQQGNSKKLRQLLERGISVNDHDEKQTTALHYAAKEGHIDSILFLIAQGADLNAITLQSETPLHFANRHEPSIRVLLEAGANPNLQDQDWNYPYYFAFYGAMTPEITRLYIQYGAHLKYVDDKNN